VYLLPLRRSFYALHSLFFSVPPHPNWAQTAYLLRFLDHTPLDIYTWLDHSERVISSSKRSLPIPHKQTQSSSGIRTGGCAVGWGAKLQARRSWFRFPMMSLEIFIDTILASLWPWGGLSLQQEWIPALFQGGKGGLHVTIVKKFWEPYFPGNLMTCLDLYCDCFTLRIFSTVKEFNLQINFWKF